MPTETNAPAVHTLLSTDTKTRLGLWARRGEGTERCQWRMTAPSWVTDEGMCMLLITRQAAGTYTIAIGRQGMCADIYTEALRKGVADLDVDAVVLDLWHQGPRSEAIDG